MTPEKYEEIKSQIIKIIEIFFPDAKIYLFGSRAKGTATDISDFDIAIDNESPMPITPRGQIIGMIDHISMAQTVDIVDFQTIPEELKQKILKDGIVWKK